MPTSGIKSPVFFLTDTKFKKEWIDERKNSNLKSCHLTIGSILAALRAAINLL